MAQVQRSALVVNGGVPGNLSQASFVNASLYVGDLEANVNALQLYDLFSQIGQVATTRICRDMTSRRSLGYGYVNYSNSQDAARALEVLNFTALNGKSIRIMYSHRDPNLRKSGVGNIFIKNLEKGIDNKTLHQTCLAFGTILSCKIATDPSGNSKGYGFVQFDNEKSAGKAIEELNGRLMNGKPVSVCPFLPRQQRESMTTNGKSGNALIGTLSAEEFKKTCPYGKSPKLYPSLGVLKTCPYGIDWTTGGLCFEQQIFYGNTRTGLSY